MLFTPKILGTVVLHGCYSLADVSDSWFQNLSESSIRSDCIDSAGLEEL